MECQLQFLVLKDKSELVPPCDECLALFKIHNFQNTLNHVPLKDPVNFKYTNTRYRNTGAGEVFMKFVGLKDIFDAVEKVSKFKNDGICAESFVGPYRKKHAVHRIR